MMRKRAFKWLLAALLLGAAPTLAQPIPKPAKAPTTLSAAQFRTQLGNARKRLLALEKRSGGGARDATNILKSLDRAQIVRRADGATQRANGNRWGALAAGASGTDFNVHALSKSEVAQLRRSVELEIAELDAWNTRTNGAYYKPVDAGAIVKQLEQSGQIRTGPLWWQTQIGAVKKAIGDAFSNFFKWLGGLFPKGTAAPTAAATSGWNFLQFLYWALIVSLLGLLGFLVYRAFAGNLRWGGRTKKSEAALEGEDAELLLLPPDELGERAAQFAREGNFREALRHRYIALLLRLDGRGVWHYDARRTNWEHIAALRRQATRNSGAIVAPLADLTRRFDRVRYGGALCEEADWQSFDDDARDLETCAGASAGERELAGAKR